MARGNAVVAQFQRRVQKTAELEGAVAENAGIRRAAGLVDGLKRLDDLPLKIVLPRKQVEWKPHPPGGLVGVGRLALTAGPQQHGGARHLVALLLQQRRRHGAVHAAGHGDQNSLHTPPSN